MIDLSTVNLQLNAMTVYRAILQDETVSRFVRALSAAQSGIAAPFCESYGALIHALWRWQVEDAKEPLSGRVTFRSPGRPQVAGEPQNTVGP